MDSRQTSSSRANRSPKTWYVSYIAHLEPHRSQRTTQTFASEAEAKTFARERLAAGDATLMAGTLNPIVPKRVIASAEMADWLGDGPS